MKSLSLFLTIPFVFASFDRAASASLRDSELAGWEAQQCSSVHTRDPSWALVCRFVKGHLKGISKRHVLADTPLSASKKDAATLQPPPPPKPTCVGQRVFLRADPVDNLNYVTEACLPGTPKGASLSVTKNYLLNTTSISASGFASLLLTAPELTSLDSPGPRFGAAAFVSSIGSLSVPFKAPEANALKFGTDLQAYMPIGAHSINTGVYFDALPYYQTDYRFDSHGYGVELAAEPIIPSLLLGQEGYQYAKIFKDYLSGFIAFRPALNLREMENTGFTLLPTGFHPLGGYTARAYINLLPFAGEDTHNLPSWLVGRLSFTATNSFYADLRSGGDFTNNSLALQYNISPCAPATQVDPKIYPYCKFQGSSAVSLEYDFGKDPDFYVRSRQLVAKLTVAY